ncbi:hypothetical protein [Vibrio sp. Hal054]|uniref:hypothetical protein n=1 Tax=Vibrio sp. Hal054 TaxID=3035158 RepID=UPI00301D4137
MKSSAREPINMDAMLERQNKQDRTILIMTIVASIVQIIITVLAGLLVKDAMYSNLICAGAFVLFVAVFAWMVIYHEKHTFLSVHAEDNA